MVPVNTSFSFFCTTPIVEEDLKQYVHEPLAALPPALGQILPPIGLLLVPHLERGAGRGPALVSFDLPPADKSLMVAEAALDNQVVIALATADVDMSEYHYTLYDAIAAQTAKLAPASFLADFEKLLREELKAEANGEIREDSWTQKQKYLHRTSGNGKREITLWNDYLRQALRDTLTLFLHGICCDIDVEAGPRQLASRYIRKRLELLKGAFPPPEGYALFPRTGPPPQGLAVQGLARAVLSVPKQLITESADVVLPMLGTKSHVKQWLNVELPKTQNLRVDLLAELESGRRTHLELQSRNDPEMPFRMLEYAVAIYRREGKFPIQLLVYVGIGRLPVWAHKRLSACSNGELDDFALKILDSATLDQLFER